LEEFVAVTEPLGFVALGPPLVGVAYIQERYRM
jgi:hypothetical protein